MYHNHQGIKAFYKGNKLVVDSLKVKADLNFNKPVNEVSEEVQKRKNAYKVSS